MTCVYSRFTCSVAFKLVIKHYDMFLHWHKITLHGQLPFEL